MMDGEGELMDGGVWRYSSRSGLCSVFTNKDHATVELKFRHVYCMLWIRVNRDDAL